VVVGPADVNAPLGEVDGGAGVADADLQRLVGRAAQDLLDDEAAQLPVGSDDQRTSIASLP
jgi:hypothetical protein